jgi:hypothetical protein
MPSPVRLAGGVRRGGEWGLRLAVLVALAWLAWRAGRPAPAESVAVARGEDAAALAAWASGSARGRVHATFDAPPAPARRDWLQALARAGTEVSWSAAAAAPTAVAVEPPATPRGGPRVRVAAPAGSRVALVDAAGPLAAIELRGAGGSAVLPTSAVGAVDATVGAVVARASLADSVALRRVLVVGRAGWEAKFVVAALQDEGWGVDARTAVAPGIAVTQGSVASIDTARYAAAVVLDSSAAAYAGRLARFTREGGGIVIAGEAAGLRALAPLAPGAPAPAAAGVAGALVSAAPRRGLTLRPITRLKVDAIPLEQRGDAVAVAARRAGAGRVMQLGYDETWRWRMLGGDGSVAAHRQWWSDVVGSVAYTPARRPAPAGDAPVVPTADVGATLPVGGPPRPGAGGAGGAGAGTIRDASSIASSHAPPDAPPDAAPYARAVAALGAPRAAAPPAAPRRGTDLPWWLFFPIAAALLAEWGSRRLRGAA